MTSPSCTRHSPRKENKLYLKPEKCEFETHTVEYLGVIIGQGQVRMDPKKVEVVWNWPTPNSKKAVQKFLGFCNFYRRFIRNFSSIAKPLTSLTGKVDFQWGTEQDDAFKRLRIQISEEPVLFLPDQHGHFRIEANSSDFANGGVLSQQVEGKWQPLTFRSQALSPVKRNYEIYDKEMLAIMDSLTDWRQYVMGAEQTVEVWSDHENLTYFRKSQKLNRRQARWLTELSEYSLQLHHKPGKTMGKADALSQMEGYDQGNNDNSDVVLLKPELFIRSIEEPDQDLLDSIKKRKTHRDAYITKRLQENIEGWLDHGDMITWEGRIYVPKDKILRSKIITMHHDSTLAGHLGQFKTLELITRSYWWPGVNRDVKQYVKGCERCQATKKSRTMPTGLLQPHDTPSKPFKKICTNMVGELPEAGGFNAIVTISDMFTKCTRFIPFHTLLASEGMARIYRDQIFAQHGLPRAIVHDRGPQYHSIFMKELYRLLSITPNYTTAYHPQTNGQSERINQELEHYLRLFINHHQNDWHEWLPLAEFTYNDRIHSSTHMSPFYADMGRHPFKGTNPRNASRNDSVQSFVDQMIKTRGEVESALTKSREDMKRYYDKHRTPEIQFKPGDKVWLDARNIQGKRHSKKLDDTKVGPFDVIKKVGPLAYRLKLPRTWKIHPVFNVVYLSPYIKPSFPTQPQLTQPPPEDIEGQEEYTVEEVIDCRYNKSKRRPKWKVRWKGYSSSEDTWEPRLVLGNAGEAVKEYHKKFPCKYKPPELRRLEIPIALFPQHLFRPLSASEDFKEPLTLPIDQTLPTETFLLKQAMRSKKSQ